MSTWYAAERITFGLDRLFWSVWPTLSYCEIRTGAMALVLYRSAGHEGGKPAVAVHYSGATASFYNKAMPEPEAGKPVASFESCLEDLEKVVKELEGGDLPLERALALFEKGVELSNACRQQLEEAETRVETLIKKNGKIQAEPFRSEKA